jgi:hypothetical protein
LAAQVTEVESGRFGCAGLEPRDLAQDSKSRRIGNRREQRGEDRENQKRDKDIHGLQRPRPLSAEKREKRRGRVTESVAGRQENLG